MSIAVVVFPAPEGPTSATSSPGVAAVSPTFKIYNSPPGTVPDTMTGGAVGGQYKVDKATVYLPSGTAGLAKPDTSDGNLVAWAVFQGTSFKFSLVYDRTSMAQPAAMRCRTYLIACFL